MNATATRTIGKTLAETAENLSTLAQRLKEEEPAAPPARRRWRPRGTDRPNHVPNAGLAPQVEMDEVEDPWLCGFRAGFRQGRVTLRQDLIELVSNNNGNGNGAGAAAEAAAREEEPRAEAAPAVRDEAIPEDTTVGEAVQFVLAQRGGWMTAREVVEDAAERGRELHPKSTHAWLWRAGKDGKIRRREKDGSVQYHTKGR